MADDTEDADYEVERILTELVIGDKPMFLVKWVGYGDEDCTWEPAEHFHHDETLKAWEYAKKVGDVLPDEFVDAVLERMEKKQGAGPVLDHTDEYSEFSEDVPTVASPRKRRQSDIGPRTTSPPAKRQAVAVIPAQDSSAMTTTQRVPAPVRPQLVSMKKGIARRVGNSTDLTRKAGQLFRNLPQARRYRKKAQAEANLYTSAMNLMTPDAWAAAAGPDTAHVLPIRSNSTPVDDRGSSLFFPEGRTISPEAINLIKVESATGSQSKAKLATIAENETSTTPKPLEIRTTAASQTPTAVSPLPATDIPSLKDAAGTRLTRRPEASATRAPSKPDTSMSKNVSGREEAATSRTQPSVTDASKLREVPETTTRMAQDFSSKAASPPRNVSTTREALAAKEIPMTEAPGKEAPIKEAPTKEAPTKEAPTKEAPTKEAPTKEAPTKEALTKEAPLRKPPTGPAAGVRAQDTDKQVVRASSGRTWIKGDIVVTLSMGRPIGDVKLVYVPWHPYGKSLVSLKRGSSLVIDFGSSALSRVQLSKYFPSRRINLSDVGIVEAFEDSESSVQKFCEYLEQHDVAAVWSRPASDTHFSILLYSCQAPSWKDLRQRQARQGRARLHVGFLPKVKLPDPDKISSPHTDALTTQTSEIPEMGNKEAQVNQDGRSKFEGYLHGLETATGGAELSLNFRSLVGGQSRSSSPGQGPRFFIAFQRLHPFEAALLYTWILTYVSPDVIFGDLNQRDWRSLVQENPASLVIFFHEDNPCYHELDGLGEFLCTDRVQVYSLSFGQYVPRTPTIVGSNRLFPRGTVFLISEKLIIEQPSQALFITRYFNKEKHSGWKIMFRPRIQAWLYSLAIGEANETRRDILLNLLVLIRMLASNIEPLQVPSLDDNDAESLDGTDESNEVSRYVISLSSLPAYSDELAGVDAVSTRDKILIDYFCGFAAVAASQYRRFWVFSKGKMAQHSGHVHFEDPDKFIKHNGHKDARRPSF